MADDDLTVIIGAGLMGAASAWALARRGRPVVVLEQFAAGHDLGGSHGSARIVRRAYGDAMYTRLTGLAFELWRELEQTSGARLLRMIGGLDFGSGRDVVGVAAHLAAAGVEHELLPAAEADARWPGLRFEGEVLFHPQAGVVDAAGAVATMLGEAERAGATVRHSTAAVSVRVVGENAEVVCSDGSTLRARRVVVAAGAWVSDLLSGVVDLPPLRVTQQQIFHFPRRDPAAEPWPTVIHERETAMYHLAGGRDGGPADDRKLGRHDGGTPTTLADRDGVVAEAARREAVDYVRDWIPGVEAVPRGEATCLYTETASEDFVLDRVGPVVVCSPCSGHGAKFSPLVGEYVAALVTGEDVAERLRLPDRFRLAAHAATPSGRPVSL